MSTQELAEANSAARERGKQLLTGHNKSLAFISRSLALPPGKQPKPKPSNRGLVVRQINQMFEDKVVADDIDDKENNPRTSLPEFIHEHLIAKSVRTPSCIHLVLETCFECAHLVAYFPPSVVRCCGGRYGLKKLADKNFRELIFGVNLHTKPGKHYDERIALFSTLCGMTDMEDFAADACGTHVQPLCSSLCAAPPSTSTYS